MLAGIRTVTRIKQENGIEKEVAYPVGLRDRALIAVMIFAFARVSAVVGLKVEDYVPLRKRWWLRLREKGGKV